MTSRTDAPLPDAPSPDAPSPVSAPVSAPPALAVRRLARRLALGLTLAALLAPAAVLVSLVRSPLPALAASLGVPLGAPVAAWQRLVVIALGAAPALAAAWALVALRAYARGVAGAEPFGVEVSRRLRTSSNAMLVASVLDLAVAPLAGLVLSWGSGRLTLTLHLGSGALLAFVLALSLRLTSGLVLEARALADENATFV